MYANYRTGSTAFGKELALKNNAFFVSEPSRNEKRKKDFLDLYYSGNKKFILKIMPDQINDLEEIQNIYNSDCFRIKIMRRNETAQILSFYTAFMKESWMQVEENIEDYFIDINYKNLDFCVKTIKKNNQLLNDCPLNFDHTFYYEDLDFDSDLTKIFKTTKPKNINILLRSITRYNE